MCVCVLPDEPVCLLFILLIKGIIFPPSLFTLWHQEEDFLSPLSIDRKQTLPARVFSIKSLPFHFVPFFVCQGGKQKASTHLKFSAMITFGHNTFWNQKALLLLRYFLPFSFFLFLIVISSEEMGKVLQMENGQNRMGKKAPQRTIQMDKVLFFTPVRHSLTHFLLCQSVIQGKWKLFPRVSRKA